MPEASDSANVSEPGLSMTRRLGRLRFGLITLGFLWLTSVVSGYFLLSQKITAVDESIKNLRFAQFAALYEKNLDFVEPKVNTIQFLRHGYSIDFDRVDYTQNGLMLSGELGNGTQLWISSLALNFSARPHPPASPGCKRQVGRPSDLNLRGLTWSWANRLPEFPPTPQPAKACSPSNSP